MQIITYAGGRGKEENWLIEETHFDERYPGKCEAIFAQGNGYLGLRHALEEQYIGETRNLFVAGSFNKASKNEVTELPNIPDITNTEIEIGRERFSLNRGTVEAYSRILNLYTGEVIRRVEWISPAGQRVKLEFHRFVSGDQLHVIGNYVEITAVDSDLDVVIRSGIDARVSNHGAQHFVEGDKRIQKERFLEYPVVTTQSGVQILVQTVHRFCGEKPENMKSRMMDDRRKLIAQYKFTIRKGKNVRMEKLSSIHSTRDLEYIAVDETKAAEQMFADGRRLIQEIEAAGYDILFAKSKRVWELFWEKQGIFIESRDNTDQVSIRFALYHLQSMTRKGDDRIGIGAKGLSGEGYKGHSFWDTETFIFPCFQFTDPGMARTLMGYRYLGLYGARKKAKENGYHGAMYPWESAWISDGEVTPDVLGVNVHTGDVQYCETGKIELHITCDIIYALWQYYIATDDEAFMRDCGYEMMIETARFWCDRLEWIEENGRYEIRDVIGPDEYKEHIDNNAYTNYMTKFILELTERLLEKLPKEQPDVYERLKELADLAALKTDIHKKVSLLYLPQPDADTGIIPQFDGYGDLREIDLTKYKKAASVGTVFEDYSGEEIGKCQAGKQADIVELLYQLDDLVSTEVKKKNYLYYEARTLHDSSLSKAIHSVLACDLGMMDEAYAMFQQAAATDMGPNMGSSDMGIHSANMGGIWQDVVMGFGGVRITDEQLRIAPHLPENWSKLIYPLCWKGRALKVTVTREELCIENQGKPVEVLLKDKKTMLVSGKTMMKL